MHDPGGVGAPRASFFPRVRMYSRLARHEIRGAALRMIGRDPGFTLAGATPESEAGLEVRRVAARAVLEAADWRQAVEAVRAAGRSSDEREKAAAMLPEDFDEFVVFGVRTVNEVLRQAAGGSARNEGGLKEGLEFEVELNRMSDAEIFARASTMVPALSKEMRPGDARPPGSAPSIEDRARLNDVVDALLRPYARLHGPLPAVLLDGAARHLAARGRPRPSDAPTPRPRVLGAGRRSGAGG